MVWIRCHSSILRPCPETILQRMYFHYITGYVALNNTCERKAAFSLLVTVHSLLCDPSRVETQILRDLLRLTQSILLHSDWPGRIQILYSQRQPLYVVHFREASIWRLHTTPMQPPFRVGCVMPRCKPLLEGLHTNSCNLYQKGCCLTPMQLSCHPHFRVGCKQSPCNSYFRGGSKWGLYAHFRKSCV